MFGFVIGTVCLLGLLGVLKAGRYRRWAHHAHRGGCGAEFGDGGSYGYGHGPGFGGWPRGPGAPSWPLRAVFARLGTTPAQEKVIREAIDEVRATARKVRGDLKAARPELAQAIRAEAFDEVLFGEISHKADEAAQAMRRAVVDAFAKVHAVLDDTQKRALADVVESGRHSGWGSWGGWGGPYRQNVWL